MPIAREPYRDQLRLDLAVPPELWNAFDLYRELHGLSDHVEHVRRAMAVYNVIMKAVYAGGGVVQRGESSSVQIPTVRESFDMRDAKDWQMLSVDVNRPFVNAVETLSAVEGLSEDDVCLSSMKNYVMLLDYRTRGEELALSAGDGFDYELRLLV